MPKAVSTLLAATVLVAVTVGVATVSTGWMSTVFSSTEFGVANKSAEAVDCTNAEIVVDAVYAKTGSNGTVTVPARNAGFTDLQIASAQLYDKLGNNFSASNLPISMNKGQMVNLKFQMPVLPNTTADSSGLGNSGNCTNMNNGNVTCGFTLDGRAKAGINFDGLNDYISHGTGSVFQPEENITIEAWIKPVITSGSNARYIVSKYDTSQSYSLEVTGAGIAWFTIMGTSQSSGREISAWTHIAGVFNGTTMVVYVNGSSTGTQSKISGITYDNTKPLLIGASVLNFQGVPQSLYNGSVDEVAVWNRSLSAEEVSISMNGISNSSMNTTGLVGYWKFDEGKGVLVCGDFSQVVAQTNCGGVSATFDRLPACS